ncbi:DUF3291 domain-containing protein [Pseudoalteromonas sp. J010]|uniref:DUF3291 domain-containing protein n=1 Tax=Pseudoalteromonas sp. J010 TaxID=998465 RepID=UPI000F648F4A|nr:DUF3291 domain-containing protein [Pseudoalteromonas sp. J010]RRS06644.1 DUF3291 domain-containing protein [Pseudoalteromonas sp. J010]
MRLAFFSIFTTKSPTNGALRKLDRNSLKQLNSLAESSPGFVCHIGEDCESVAATDLFGCTDVLVTLAVWRSERALREFMSHSLCQKVFSRSTVFLDGSDPEHYVVWRLENDTLPTLHEAKARLDYLRRFGSSDYAFNCNGYSEYQLSSQQDLLA